MLRRVLRMSCIAALVVILLSGCESSDYKKAVSLFENQEYNLAYEMFVALEDYEDSAAMAVECEYQIALKSLEAGAYEDAYSQFEQLDGYSDSDEMMLKCKYLMGLACIDDGDYLKARDYLKEATNYEDSEEILKELPSKILIHYLEKKQKLIYENPDPKYTVTMYAVDDRTIVMDYLTSTVNSSTELEQNVTMKLVLGEPHAAVTGSSYMSITFIGKSESKERVGGTLDIQLYRYGDELVWDDYDFEGHDIYGQPLDYQVSGMLHVASNAPLERIVSGVAAILEEHDLGITLADIGFASVDK